MRQTVRLYGKRHRLEDVFASGEIGFSDFSSPGINVIPNSVSVETITIPDNLGLPVRHVFRVTISDGTTHDLNPRWVKKIGRCVIDPQTQQVDWANE